MEGELNEIGLTSLMQMLCNEQLRLALHLSRHGEEGTIYIDNGSIVHASVGYCQGEDAFYELGAWTDGSFRVTHLHSAPPRTIERSLHYLLMEAMRQLDERRHFEQLEKPLSRTALAADQALEESLLGSLAQAERLIDRLRSRKLRRKPALALEIMAEMINHFVELAESVKPVDAFFPSLTQVLETTAVDHEQVRLVEVEAARISVHRAIGLYEEWAGEPADRERLFRGLERGLASVVTRFGMGFVGFFGCPEMAEEWAETYKVFALDLKQALEQVSFLASPRAWRKRLANLNVIRNDRSRKLTVSRSAHAQLVCPETLRAGGLLCN